MMPLELNEGLPLSKLPVPQAGEAQLPQSPERVPGLGSRFREVTIGDKLRWIDLVDPKPEDRESIARIFKMDEFPLGMFQQLRNADSPAQKFSRDTYFYLCIPEFVVKTSDPYKVSASAVHILVGDGILFTTHTHKSEMLNELAARIRNKEASLFKCAGSNHLATILVEDLLLASEKEILKLSDQRRQFLDRLKGAPTNQQLRQFSKIERSFEDAKRQLIRYADPILSLGDHLFGVDKPRGSLLRLPGLADRITLEISSNLTAMKSARDNWEQECEAAAANEERKQSKILALVGIPVGYCAIVSAAVDAQSVGWTTGFNIGLGAAALIGLAVLQLRSGRRIGK